MLKVVNTMFASIIVPVYNGEKYIDSSLQSVLRQTRSDFEVVLIDDGSTDSSPQICNRYATADARIRVFHQENLGQIVARHRGADVSRGDFLFFVDCDDEIDENLLESVGEIIDHDDVDVVLYGYVRVLRNGIERNAYGIMEQSGKLDKDVLYRHMYSSSLLNSLWCKAVKREVYLKIADDASQWKDVRVGEDQLESLRILDVAKSFFYLNRNLYYYFDRPRSISKSDGVKASEDLLFVRRILYSHLVAQSSSREDMSNFGRYFLESMIDTLSISASFGLRESFFISFQTLRNSSLFNELENANCFGSIRRIVDKVALDLVIMKHVRLLYWYLLMLRTCRRIKTALG